MKNLFKTLSLPLSVSIALLILRLVAGLAFMYHGYDKVQNLFTWMGSHSAMPGFLQALAALSEFPGGLLWMIGFLTPVVSLGLFCTMSVAVLMHLFVFHDPFVGSGGSYELALLFLCVSFLLLLSGPGSLSVDKMIFGERPRGLALKTDKT